MIAIIGAMREEIEHLKTKISHTTKKTYQNIDFYEGFLNDKKVVLMRSGIGKVNAASSSTILFEQYEVDCVINIGTAGGIIPQAKVCDVVISSKVAYHDVDVTAFQYEYGQVPDLPVFFQSNDEMICKIEGILKENAFRYHKGLIVSGDSFIHKAEQLEKIKSHFADVIAVEMEACAIAHVCHIYQKPFLILRSLSDIAGVESDVSFEQYIHQASLNAGIFVEKLVELI